MPSPLSSRAVAVITVSYNSSGELDGFLDSVAHGELAPHTFIADNASADLETSRAIAATHDATVIAVGENRGYGGAINAAATALPDEVEYILVSNPDVRLSPDSLERLVRAMSEDATVGAVGPRVLNIDGTPYPSARSFPSLRTGIGHAVFFSVWPRNPWSRRYLAHRDDSIQPRPVDWLSGSCVLVRRAAFRAVGGFDEGYFMYFEDVDLGYRLAKAGWRRLFLPTASVVHSGAHSTTTESARMIRAHHDSAYRYLSRKYSGPLLAPLRWTLKLGLDLRAAYLTRRGD
ncbi:glycosyltransferase family 2 protein [Leifsonia sp. McL0607]|uniref:glycosyltransferase family 2 protein n=1 Tax=Leifsonia sp. McL0607 TaxID=3415672 RepID=UPI003CF51D1F